jgi:hypothetical protein
MMVGWGRIGGKYRVGSEVGERVDVKGQKE